MVGFAACISSPQMIRRIVHAGDDFFAGLQVADADVGVVVQLGGVGGFQFLRAFELFVGFGGGERVVHGKPGGAQFVDEFQGLRADVGVVVQLGGVGGFQFLRAFELFVTYTAK